MPEPVAFGKCHVLDNDPGHAARACRIFGVNSAITSVGEHFDVLIVGAGILGISGAWQLCHQRPGSSFVVLEAEGSFGGTWLTHRFPGIRSDSDL
jgi:heterodisulfide reductase subunit A-like polyferredoxin